MIFNVFLGNFRNVGIYLLGALGKDGTEHGNSGIQFNNGGIENVPTALYTTDHPIYTALYSGDQPIYTAL